MKPSPTSPRRRQVLIAGVLTATAPLSLFASDCQPVGSVLSDIAGTVAPGLGDKLVISGRVVDDGRNAVAGASVEAPFAENARTTSDADGRFMLVIDRRSAEVAQSMQLRVTHAEHRPGMKRIGLTQNTNITRDEAGAWRTAVSLVLA